MLRITGPGTARLNRLAERDLRNEKERLEKLAGSRYADLSDRDLNNLLKAGYEQVRYELGQRKVREFLARHPELPQEVKGFPIVFTYEEGLINLHLRIPPWGVSTRQLRGAERELESIRKVVRPYQLEGISAELVDLKKNGIPTWPKKGTPAEPIALKKKGASDAAIARYLNERLADSLKEYRKYEFYWKHDAEGKIPGIDYKALMDWERPYPLYLLAAMGISEREAEQIVAEGLKVITVAMKKWPPPQRLTLKQSEELEMNSLGFDDSPDPDISNDEILATKGVIQWSAPVFRGYRMGQAYLKPITASHVRAKLRSLHLP